MNIEQALVVDDEPLMRKFLAETLRRQDLDVTVAKNGEEALEILKGREFDIVFSDIRMPGAGGMDILSNVKSSSPETSVIMMTAYGTVESAVDAMKMGAEDYLLKPFMPDQVETLLEKIQKRKNLINENRYLRSEIDKKCGFGEIVGQSKVMKDIFSLIAKVAKSKATVLIHGESGTGKELVARAIHYNSPRSENSFIKVNCAALPETLLESELFGHEKGAFTGAGTKRLGRFELADKGTLLLDEISEITPEIQAKLLRVLQEREFERVGGMRSINVDVRMISTTNRNLTEEIKNGTFREDLYYRLNVVPVHLPPLRDRKEDIPLLAEYFLDKYCKENGREKMTISEDAVKEMVNYSWPGNIRELENIIERAVVICEDQTLKPEHFSKGMLVQGNSSAGSQFEAGLSLREMEKRLIVETLNRENGNRTKTADVLKISIRTLRNKLNEYESESENKEICVESKAPDSKPANIASVQC